jgi:hypothetical protein
VVLVRHPPPTPPQPRRRARLHTGRTVQVPGRGRNVRSAHRPRSIRRLNTPPRPPGPQPTPARVEPERTRPIAQCAWPNSNAAIGRQVVVIGRADSASRRGRRLSPALRWDHPCASGMGRRGAGAGRQGVRHLRHAAVVQGDAGQRGSRPALATSPSSATRPLYVSRSRRSPRSASPTSLPASSQPATTRSEPGTCSVTSQPAVDSASQLPGRDRRCLASGQSGRSREVIDRGPRQGAANSGCRWSSRSSRRRMARGPRRLCQMRRTSSEAGAGPSPSNRLLKRSRYTATFELKSRSD